MPRTYERARREMWLGFGEAWTMATELIAAVGIWAAIGYGLDAWLGTEPVMLVMGAVVGYVAGIYLLVLRSRRMGRRAMRGRTG